jgi:hypothetical protein
MVKLNKNKKDKLNQKIQGDQAAFGGAPLGTNSSVTSSKRRQTSSKQLNSNSKGDTNYSKNHAHPSSTMSAGSRRRRGDPHGGAEDGGYLHGSHVGGKKKDRKSKSAGGGAAGGAGTGAGGAGLSHPPIQDYNDLEFIGKIAAHLTSKIGVDRRSIGGEKLFQKQMATSAEKANPPAGRTRTSATKDAANLLLESQAEERGVLKHIGNEELMTIRVARFDIFHRGQPRPLYTGMGGASTSAHSSLKEKAKMNRFGAAGGVHSQNQAVKHRYVSLVRSTSRPLVTPKKKGSESNLESRKKSLQRKKRLEQKRRGSQRDDDLIEEEDALSEPDEDYDDMYEEKGKKNKGKDGDDTEDETDDDDGNDETDGEEAPDGNELSSFPVLVLMAASEQSHHHGGRMATQLEVRKAYPLEELITVECLPSANAKSGGGGLGGGVSGALNSNTLDHADVGSVLLTFKNGESVEIDCCLPPEAFLEAPSGDNDDDVEVDVDAPPPPPNGSSAVSADSKKKAASKEAGGGAAGGTGGSVGANGAGGANGGGVGGLGDTASSHDFFLWSLFQIHTMLCTCVVERSVMQYRVGQKLLSFAKRVAMKAQLAAGTATNNPDGRNIAKGDKPPANLPALTLRNVDRSELQYLSTVNGFVTKSRKIFTMLRRQRYVHARKEYNQSSLVRGRGTTISEADDNNSDDDEAGKGEEEEGEFDVQKKKKKRSNRLRLDDLALDLLMMAGGTSFVVTNQDHGSIFTSNDEEQDACQVLNKAIAQHNDLKSRSSTMNVVEVNDKQAMDAVVTGGKLHEMLQKRMRDLEADACRRLIAWEDEKQTSSQALDLIDTHRRNERDMVDCMSLVGLFATLDELDGELKTMESWLQERVAFIRPLTNECRAMEEENRGLEQQYKSCDALKTELALLLDGLEVPSDLQDVLRNPRRSLSVNRVTGVIDLEGSAKGIDSIKDAGKELRRALDKAMGGGGLHLDAVYERVEDLISLATKFCSELNDIAIEVMRTLANDVVPPLHTANMPKNETHASMARKIRDVSAAESRVLDRCRNVLHVSSSKCCINLFSSYPSLFLFFRPPTDSTQVPIIAPVIHQVD